MAPNGPQWPPTAPNGPLPKRPKGGGRCAGLSRGSNRFPCRGIPLGSQRGWGPGGVAQACGGAVWRGEGPAWRALGLCRSAARALARKRETGRAQAPVGGLWKGGLAVQGPPTAPKRARIALHSQNYHRRRRFSGGYAARSTTKRRRARRRAVDRARRVRQPPFPPTGLFVHASWMGRPVAALLGPRSPEGPRGRRRFFRLGSIKK
jgi:hypothetical protein